MFIFSSEIFFQTSNFSYHREKALWIHKASEYEIGKIVYCAVAVVDKKVYSSSWDPEYGQTFYPFRREK